MMGKEKYVWVIDGLIDKAYHDYFQTEEHAASETELQPAEEELRSKLTREDHQLVSSYLDLLNSAADKQERYLYRRGLVDSVRLLKWLEVIT